MENTFYFAVDVETTTTNYDQEGKPLNNELLEISFYLLSEKLGVIEKGSAVIKHDPAKLVMDDYVREMHTKTGLLEKLPYGQELSNVELAILATLVSHGVTRVIPLGNNVQFDVEVIRRHMPHLFSIFHYSYLDVSCVRNMLGFVNKELAEELKESKLSNHNSFVDIKECLLELITLQHMASVGFNQYVEKGVVKNTINALREGLAL